MFLEAFEGPKLLLYLIQPQNLDILEIRVAITQQYMQYVEQHAMQFELAADTLSWRPCWRRLNRACSAPTR